MDKKHRCHMNQIKHENKNRRPRHTGVLSKLWGTRYYENTFSLIGKTWRACIINNAK